MDRKGKPLSDEHAARMVAAALWVVAVVELVACFQ